MADTFRRIPYKGTRASDPRADYYNKGFTLRQKEWPLAGAISKATKQAPGDVQRAPEAVLPGEDYKDLWWENRPPLKKSKRPGETGRSEDI